jgi:dTMP kinase
MPHRQKFLAIEGIDGAGKRTQMDLLCRLLDRRKVNYVHISFPRYESFFGQMVGRYLNGEFGPLEAVEPHFSAVLYAGDRLEAKTELEEALLAGKLVLADRYVGSNLAHQTARVRPESREEFLMWLKQLEYEIYGLPVEDLVVYLRLPAAEAQRLVSKKAVREYTKLQRDLQEANLAHLEQAAQVYDRLAKEPNWASVECFDAAARRLRPPEEILREVVATIEKRAPFLLKA